MMCLLWGQTEFAEGTVKVRSRAVPRDFMGHLRSGSSRLAFRPGLCGEQGAVMPGEQTQSSLERCGHLGEPGSKHGWDLGEAVMYL